MPKNKNTEGKSKKKNAYNEEIKTEKAISIYVWVSNVMGSIVSSSIINGMRRQHGNTISIKNGFYGAKSDKGESFAIRKNDRGYDVKVTDRFGKTRHMQYDENSNELSEKRKKKSTWELLWELFFR